VLGYPTHLLSTLQPPVGYRSALLKCCRATVKEKCTRILAACVRPITFAPGLGIHSGKVNTEVRYPRRGKKVLG
jgi:hypothetical protein